MTVRDNFVNFHTSTSTSITTNGAQNAGKIFERIYETNSTDDLFSPSFNKKKQISNYRFSHSRKIDSASDYVEENTFLESDPTIEIAFDNDENMIRVSKC
ncbi:hypothetical protein ACH3XW_36395 [Acanthocheilonema viteae]